MYSATLKEIDFNTCYTRSIENHKQIIPKFNRRLFTNSIHSLALTDSYSGLFITLSMPKQISK